MPKKLPTISEETLKKLLEDPKVQEDLRKSFDKLDKSLLPKKGRMYHCDMCRDRKRVMVCGGPDQDCPCCGPRY